MSSKLCTRLYHDAYGKPYDSCDQCFIRDNGPWPENPLLKAIDSTCKKPTKEELPKLFVSVSLGKKEQI